MTTRHWSLTRRLTLFFLLATTALIATVAWVSDNYLRDATALELDATAVARLKDLRVRSQASPSMPREELIDLADQISSEGSYAMLGVSGA